MKYVLAKLHVDVQGPPTAILIKCIIEIMMFQRKHWPTLFGHEDSNMYRYGCLWMHIFGYIQHPNIHK